MYYKIRNDVLFREYKEHGYITDNSEFGYQFLNDAHLHPGEKFISKSGAVMLATLKKIPRDIDEIIADLMQIFRGVEYDELKQDTIEFFQWLTDEGYLSIGETYETCIDKEIFIDTSKIECEKSHVAVAPEDCGKNLISQNDFLRTIHFDITSICNERCVHCYIPHECKTKEIDSELFYKILETGRKMNIIHVTLSGGEPLLHKDFLQFLVACREKDLSVNVLSNLTLLTDDLIEEMKKNPLLSVQASLYSMNPEIHDSITRANGSFEKTRTNILKLCSSGIPVQISCPVMKQNKDSFKDVIRWGAEHNIAVAVEPVIFASYDHSGSNLTNRLCLDELGVALDKQLAEGYAEVFKEAAEKKESFKADNPICSVCRYSFCVSVEGNVFPCAGWQANVLGNLNDKSAQEIWENSEKIKELRTIKRKDFPNCIECKDRGYCTVCMMSNANEDPNGNPFKINDFHCKAAALLHQKIDEFYSNL